MSITCFVAFLRYVLHADPYSCASAALWFEEYCCRTDSLIADFAELQMGLEDGSLHDHFFLRLSQLVRLPIRQRGLGLLNILKTSPAAYFASTMRADALVYSSISFLHRPLFVRV